MDRSVRRVLSPHRPRQRASETGPFLVAILLALALHGALLLPALAHWMMAPPDGGKAGRRIQVVALSRAQWEKNRKLEARPEEKKPPERKPQERHEDESPVPPGQVVSLPPPLREEAPERADYASEWNQRVERETRSRHQTHAFKNPTNKPQDGLDVQKQAPESATLRSSPLLAAQPRPPGGPKGPGQSLSGSSGTDATSGAGEQLFALEIPKQAPRAGLQLQLDPEGILQNREHRAEIDGSADRARLAMGRSPDMARRSGDGGEQEAGQGLRGGAGRDGLPSLEELTPSLGRLERIAGMPANDHLPEVETDAETRLNAWRWKHSTFFNRIADSIRRTWHGGEVLSTTDPTGQLYGFQDRLTIVQVTLDRQGNIVDIAIAEPSGAGALDDEAVRAFKEAGPFSNPPEALFRGGEKFTFLFGFNISYARGHLDLNWRPY